MLHNITLYLGREWNVVHKFLLQTFHTNDEILKYVGFGWVAIIILGIVLGANKKIAVYNTYDDVGRVFIGILIPILCWVALFCFHPKMNTVAFEIVKYCAIIFESAYILTLFIDTWKRNRSIIKTLIAFITKMSLALFLVLNVLMIFLGQKRANKGKEQAPVLIETGMLQSLLMTGMVAMLILYLVDDKGYGIMGTINRRIARDMEAA